MSIQDDKLKTTADILNSHDFQELLKERRKLGLPIVAVIIIAYFSFILLIAFNPAILGQTIGDGKVSIGIYAGLALLVLSFLLTALYLHFSNGRIADLQDTIRSKFR